MIRVFNPSRDSLELSNIVARYDVTPEVAAVVITLADLQFGHRYDEDCETQQAVISTISAVETDVRLMALGIQFELDSAMDGFDAEWDDADWYGNDEL